MHYNVILPGRVKNRPPGFDMCLPHPAYACRILSRKLFSIPPSGSFHAPDYRRSRASHAPTATARSCPFCPKQPEKWHTKLCSAIHQRHHLRRPQDFMSRPAGTHARGSEEARDGVKSTEDAQSKICICYNVDRQKSNSLYNDTLNTFFLPKRKIYVLNTTLFNICNLHLHIA